MASSSTIDPRTVQFSEIPINEVPIDSSCPHSEDPLSAPEPEYKGLGPEPKFKTSGRVNKIAGIITLVLSIILIVTGIYFQFAATWGWWPFSMDNL